AVPSAGAVPSALPEALLKPVAEPAADLALRFAETHGPFTAAELAARYATSPTLWQTALHRLVARGALREGSFRPTGSGHEFCSAIVLERARRLALAQARRAAAPVSEARYTTFLLDHQHVTRPLEGLDGVL